MTIIMTVAGVDCDAKVLDNEITCRIPKNMTIPTEGLAVKVSQGLGIRVMINSLTYLGPTCTIGAHVFGTSCLASDH